MNGIFTIVSALFNYRDKQNRYFVNKQPEFEISEIKKYPFNGPQGVPNSYH